MMFKGQGRDSLASFWGFALVTFLLAALAELLAWGALFGGLYPQQYVQQLETSMHAAAFPLVWLTLYMQLFVLLPWLVLLLPLPAAILRRLRHVGVGTGRLMWSGGSMLCTLALALVWLGMRGASCPEALLYGVGLLSLLSLLIMALFGMATLIPLFAPGQRERTMQPPGIRRLLS